MFTLSKGFTLNKTEMKKAIYLYFECSLRSRFPSSLITLPNYLLIVNVRSSDQMFVLFFSFFPIKSLMSHCISVICIIQENSNNWNLAFLWMGIALKGERERLLKLNKVTNNQMNPINSIDYFVLGKHFQFKFIINR